MLIEEQVLSTIDTALSDLRREWIDLLLMCESLPERILYATMLANGLGSCTTPQVQVRGRRIDFGIEAAGLQFAIECDGYEYHDKTPEQAAKDKQRDRELIRDGWIPIHYAAREIMENPQACVDQIIEIVFDKVRVDVGRRRKELFV